MSIMQYLEKIWDEFEEWLDDVGDFIKPLAKQIKKSGGKFLLETAYAAVVAAEAAGGSGGDKFKAAQDTIKIALTAQGIPIVLNAINGAIESAVAKMKEE